MPSSAATTCVTAPVTEPAILVKAIGERFDLISLSSRYLATIGLDQGLNFSFGHRKRPPVKQNVNPARQR